MTVHRLHLRPSGGLDDPTVTFEFCQKNKVLGMGWRINKRVNSDLKWSSYLKEAIPKHGEGKLQMVKYLHNKVKIGDLIWTRDPNGKYYIAKVEEPWFYIDTKESRDADILNAVKFDLIIELDRVDEVPGKIVACFRPGATIQPIKSKKAKLYTEFLWYDKTNDPDYKSDQSELSDDLFFYLDDSQVEDAVFIYLQYKGWYVIPSSRKHYTMKYEYSLINSSTGKSAIVQAKTGKVSLTADNWKNIFKSKVFLFQSEGRYHGDEDSEVVFIDPSELDIFIKEHRDIFPLHIRNWVNFIEQNHT